MPRTPGARPATPLRHDEAEVARAVARIEALTRLMDTAIRLPGSNVRVGLDAALGLVPVIGDLVSQLMSIYIMTEARRLRAPPGLIARMLANSLFDTVLGSVPLAGDVFDVWFRANVRNLALLKAHLKRTGMLPPESGPQP